ncbi:hypothetical protein [Rhodococcus sp. 27YEA15]|uniref:hypothetical protein n=1 Tax=Rhodococcus sp. 27YEA15 TaxID=3156259 RepID=UPI003C7AD8C8
MTEQVAVFDPQKQWVFGYKRFGNDALPDHLLLISTHHAHSAIKKAGSTEPTIWLEAAIHAGAAVELLAKTLLVVGQPGSHRGYEEYSESRLASCDRGTDRFARGNTEGSWAEN